MATAEGVATLIAAAPDADILVKNVGTAHIREYRGVDDIAAIPDEDWLGLFQLNVMRGVRATRHYLPRMEGRGRWEESRGGRGCARTCICGGAAHMKKKKQQT